MKRGEFMVSLVAIGVALVCPSKGRGEHIYRTNYPFPITEKWWKDGDDVFVTRLNHRGRPLITELTGYRDIPYYVLGNSPAK